MAMPMTGPCTYVRTTTMLMPIRLVLPLVAWLARWLGRLWPDQPIGWAACGLASMECRGMACNGLEWNGTYGVLSCAVLFVDLAAFLADRR